MSQKTKIEWCDITWNPVWGCLRGCEYCYAKRISRRFYRKIGNIDINYKLDNNIIPYSESLIERYEEYDNLYNFHPIWLESNFQKKFPKKPSHIFVNSMSDICYWQPEWIYRVFDRIKQYPQHKFLFLTKDMKSYFINYPENCWLGITAADQKQMDNLGSFTSSHIVFISVEPIQEKIKLTVKPNWLIIGAETGNRKNKVIPEKSWIANLLLEADRYLIPVFMKDNLKPVWGNELIQEWPE
jgi:protein gp37